MVSLFFAHREKSQRPLPAPSKGDKPTPWERTWGMWGTWGSWIKSETTTRNTTRNDQLGSLLLSPSRFVCDSKKKNMTYCEYCGKPNAINMNPACLLFRYITITVFTLLRRYAETLYNRTLCTNHPQISIFTGAIINKPQMVGLWHWSSEVSEFPFTFTIYSLLIERIQAVGTQNHAPKDTLQIKTCLSENFGSPGPDSAGLPVYPHFPSCSMFFS